MAPRNSLEDQLTKIWETVLGRQPIGVTDNFFNLGGESLMALQLCSEMERTLHVKIPVPLIFHAQTIEQLAKEIGQSGQYERLSLLVPIQSNGSNPPIFCVGFGSSFRRYLQEYPEQPLYMFLKQGYDGRPILHTTVEKLATLCLKEMRTVQPKGPYYLAGYSFHGMVVYEMAQQLHRQGESIGLLALVDPRPFLSQQAPPPTWGKQLTQLLTTTTNWEQKRSTRLKTFSHALSKKAMAALKWRVKRLKNTSWITCKLLVCHVYFGLGYPLPTSLRPFYRRKIRQQAATQYIPQHYHGGIVLFQTMKHVETYWSKLCTEVVQVFDLPCTHSEILRDSLHAPTLLHQLMNHLEEAKKNKS